MPAPHILLVEDDPDLLSLLTEVLEDEGYRVTGASRRQEARAALRKGDVDLLVADSVLRGGNGDDVASAASRRGLPIIMMSGEPDRIARLSRGPVPFLQKPFRAAALMQLVRQLLP
jgi:DNA-binding response OmpR family regulator